MNKENTTSANINFFKAIIAYLQEKGRKCVTFQKNTYGDENDIPFCNTLQEVIDTVSIDDELPGRIYISVVREDGYMAYEQFDGTENEDFDYLFDEVYHYINDAEDPEMEEWLEANGFGEKTALTEKVYTKAKRIKSVIDGHYCGLHEKEFLKQFGIRPVSGLHDSNDESHWQETPWDRAIFREGLSDCNNESENCYVAEKDGLQFCIFMHSAQLYVSIHFLILETNELFTVSRETERKVFGIPNPEILLHYNAVIAEAVADKAGMNVPYCESIDLGEAFPTVLQLAIDPAGFENKDAALETLRFMAENGRLFPKSFSKKDNIGAFAGYVLEHEKEILCEIESDLNGYYRQWIGNKND